MIYAVDVVRNDTEHSVDENNTMYEDVSSLRECLYRLCMETPGNMHCMTEREDGSHFVDIGETKDCIIRFHIQTEDAKEKQEQVFIELRTNLNHGRRSKERMEKAKQIITEYGSSYFETFRNGIGLFCVAASYGYTDVLELLLELGVDVNTTDQYGNNAIVHILKTSINPYETMKFLIEKGVDVNTVETKRDSPLLETISQDLYEEGRLLYENGANVNVIYNGPGIRRKNSVEYGVVEKIKFLRKEERGKWMSLFLQEPERCEEELLRQLRVQRLELVFD